MFKSLLSLPLALLCAMSASAQFMYTIKDTTTPYAQLAGATSINGNLIWDDEIFPIPLPFTWTMNSDKHISDYLLHIGVPAIIDDSTVITNVEGFIIGDIDIEDRGAIGGGKTKSPLRYLTTGTAPDRIFKVEIANAGFFDEHINNKTMNDSFYLQIWVYETSNIVEYHYGPSRITHPAWYFGFGSGGPFVAYAKRFDAVSETYGDFWFLTGKPTAPTLDSVFAPLTVPPVGLSSWPANGKVYRFTPKNPNVGIASTSSGNIIVHIYPTPATTQLRVDFRADCPQSAAYEICSVTGSVVSTGQLHCGVQSIDIGSFAAGSYFLQIKTKDAYGNFRFVKQ